MTGEPLADGRFRERSFARPAGPPALHARFRVAPEDFQVRERLPREPAGEGEHLWLRLRRSGANTDWVAGRLAEAAGVAPSAVGYAGLKDRHAVVEQWFSLHWPRGEEPPLASLRSHGITVLEQARDTRKLRRGALAENRFRLVLRDLASPGAGVAERLASIRSGGFPNYFGEQRFGHDRGNLERAWRSFTGGPPIRRRHLRSLALSAARAWLFNLVLDRRVRDGSWASLLPGEVLALEGSRSWFKADPQDHALARRLAAGDIHPTGPLWGRGALPSAGTCREVETGALAGWETLCRGLEGAGLRQDRRPLRTLPRELAWSRAGPAELELRFALPPGAYATALLAALGEIEDAARAALSRP